MNTHITSPADASSSFDVPNIIRHWFGWAQRAFSSRYLMYSLTFAAIISGIATYFAITQSKSPFGPDPDLVIGLVLTDLSLLLLLAVILSKRFISLWLANRRGSTGSRLQTRIVLLFSLVSIVPTIIVAIFSTLFFNFGIQSWFDQRVSTALEESVSVAESYLEEHKKVLEIATQDIANGLSRSVKLITTNPALFERKLASQITIRSLSDGIVFWYNRNATVPSLSYNIIARSSLSFALAFDIPPPEAIHKAAQGEMVLIADPDSDHVRALVKLDNIADTYLLAGRYVDTNVLNHMEKTQGAALEYKYLKAKISDLQIKFSFIFMTVALLLLFVAMWVGMVFASNFTKPISNIINATERVKEGDLKAEVAEGPDNDELATLGRAFNRMTSQLAIQREALISANQQIDARRRFSEAVLSGVSAGVIALNDEKYITLTNPKAPELLNCTTDQLQDVHYSRIIPELSPLLTLADKQPDKTIEQEITIERHSKRTTLLVHVSTERTESNITGYVITFDDITQLVAAQRSAAWSDVARRIAHEIKNPLTPIHLAAERLRKKYADHSGDPDNFVRYTDTITRHVHDIGTMVEEFASFARMPTPQLSATNICELIRNAVFSQECAHESISYHVDLPNNDVILRCDTDQMHRVLTNICKNASESLESSQTSHKNIHVKLSTHDAHCVITISDNGKGFPLDKIDQLTEPYVTTRSKGTGLGLAIVKKIITDHYGHLSLENLPTGGACVTIELPL